MVFWRFWKRGHLRYQALLSEYIDNRLNTADQSHLEEHLRGCAKCSKDLESLQATAGLLRDVPMVETPRSFKLQAAPTEKPGKPVLLWSVQASTVAAAMLLVALVAGDLAGAFDSDRALGEPEISDDQQAYEIAASDYQLETVTPTPAPGQAPAVVENSNELMQAQELSSQDARDTGTIPEEDVMALEEAESPEASAAHTEVEELAGVAPTDTGDGDSVVREIEIAVASALGVLVVATGYLTYRRRRGA